MYKGTDRSFDDDDDDDDDEEEEEDDVDDDGDDDEDILRKTIAYIPNNLRCNSSVSSSVDQIHNSEVSEHNYYAVLCYSYVISKWIAGLFAK